MRALILLIACLRGWAQVPAEMVQIPAGEFTMGRTKLTPDDKTKMRPVVLLDDRPDHKVQLDAFLLDKTEVTHAQYAEFVKVTRRKPPYHWLNGAMPADLSNHPIYNVDWDDASAYCKFREKRLPTEAEWERAARGGKDSLSYPWGDKADAKMALYNTQTGPVPVGKFPPNGFGLHDMSGSVSEWCADWFEREYYAHSPAANPKGPETGMYKVIRGGAWSDSPARITVFFRNWVRPNQKTPNLGFRCAR
ncbi:MAG: formylglycine-generating enzyme family protein [Acidobacteria bacterium]|nr:formylglycine-generating enzyme family protein [Acidobacteriota bacterium]